MGFGFFPFDFPNPPLSTNHLTSNFVPDLPPPKLLERTQMGTHLIMARSIQIHPLEISTSPTARSRPHPLLHEERPYLPPGGPQGVADAF